MRSKPGEKENAPPPHCAKAGRVYCWEEINVRSSGVEHRELRTQLGKGQIMNGFVSNSREFKLCSENSRRTIKDLRLGVSWSALCFTAITLVAV